MRHDGIMKSGAAEAIANGARIGPRVQKKAKGGRMAIRGGGHQMGDAAMISSKKRDASLAQKAQALRAIQAGGLASRRDPMNIDRARVGAGAQKKSQAIGMIGLDGVKDRGALAQIPEREIGAGAQKKLDDRGLAGAASERQQSVAAELLDGGRVGAELQERFDEGEIPGETSGADLGAKSPIQEEKLARIGRIRKIKARQKSLQKKLRIGGKPIEAARGEKGGAHGRHDTTERGSRSKG